MKRSTAAFVALVAVGSWFALEPFDRPLTHFEPTSPASVEAATLPSAPSALLDPVEMDARVRLDPPDPSGKEPEVSEATASAWDTCMAFESDWAAFESCLSEQFAAAVPSGEELGEWICSTDHSRLHHGAVVREVLRHTHPNAVFGFVDALQTRCDKYKFRALMASCVSAVGQENPTWLESVAAAASADQIFDASKGRDMVELLEVLDGMVGKEWSRYLLEEGGRGAFGGSPQQIERAATTGLLVQTTPEDRRAYIGSVLESSSAPGDGRFCQIIVAVLCSPTGNCWTDGDSTQALELALLVLENPRFSRGAAAQVLRICPDKPPEGCNAEVWAQLRSTAQAILESNR